MTNNHLISALKSLASEVMNLAAAIESDVDKPSIETRRQALESAREEAKAQASRARDKMIRDDLNREVERLQGLLDNLDKE